MKWQRVCCYCNKLIEGKGVKVGRCSTDDTVFWAHPKCYAEDPKRYGETK